MKIYIVEVYENRTEWKNEDGKLHRLDGPAIEYANGDKSWYVNGERHRTDGPAIEWTDGYNEWHVNGKLHRLDGPAIEWTKETKGAKHWYVNGERHRTDGPAIVHADGNKSWWVDGNQLSESEFNYRVGKPSCEGRIVEVDGVKYKLVKA